MSMDTQTISTVDDAQSYRIVRAALWLVKRLRPTFGWGVLLVMLVLSALPAFALRTNRWVDLGSMQGVLEASGPLAVLTVWWLWGWSTPRPNSRRPWRGIAALGVGILLISQLLLGWIPGPDLWLRAIDGPWTVLFTEPVEIWVRFFVRNVLWWRGFLAGGAAQDNLVFASLATTILWWCGMVAAWLARRTEQGYAAAAPVLWLLGFIILYSSSGRMLLVAGLALTILMQLLMDHQSLHVRWNTLALDYSPAVFVDRAIMVAGAAALILTLAAVLPNLYYEPLVSRYYERLGPVLAQFEEVKDRLFPDLRGTSRLRGGGGAGLPNDFLLRGGPDLSNTVVMEVRTDEPIPNYELTYEEMIPPQGHYMRGGTLSRYDGRGWSNPRGDVREEVAANSRWREVGWGRRPLVQSVVMMVSSPNLYAAADPVEFSVDAQLELDEGDSFVRAFGREPSYTVVSAVPAVNETMLRDLPDWGSANPLPTEYEAYVELPDTVTARTRDLVASIVQDAPTDYDKALAIEQYLRQFQYDLDVSDPPRRVEDVADYFLFELQRGYCDYYATAFVVMARMAGLPARFVTGFAVGRWNFATAVWLITEAEAHSWPEVYFPDVGWIAFEPTAGRPNLVRIAPASASATTASFGGASVPLPRPDETESAWNLQMVVWLLLLAATGWAAYAAIMTWRVRRQDPWTTLLQWGARAGRPMGPGDTVLEYGDGLATHVATLARADADARRHASRQIRELSHAVSDLRYRTGNNEAQVASIRDRWQRLRGYLKLVGRRRLG